MSFEEFQSKSDTELHELFCVCHQPTAPNPRMDALQHYCLVNNPTMRMEHKAGDKMFIDYTGDKLWIYPHAESSRQVEVFVAILGCSLLTYFEAVSSQTKEDFISACENAFYNYGRIPQAMEPDNLKAVVTGRLKPFCYRHPRYMRM